MSSQSADVVVPPSVTTRDELVALHKKQQKDLIATITGLKKQATKKTRKNVNIKCQELQDDLDRKQNAQLALFEGDGDNTSISDNTAEVTPELLLSQMSIDETPKPTVTSETAPGKKRNRQKERLAKRNAKIEQIKQDALEESKDAVDYRAIEMDTMNNLLILHGLELFEIRPDGNCLFNSIADQLQTRHNVTKSVEDLRSIAAQYIQDHPDDFVPFLMEKEDLIDIDKYCQTLVETVMWGSDIEILAFSQVFDCPIEILLAGSDKIQFNESGTNPKLVLGFYKHSFGLGEHYNSLRPLA